MPFSPPLPVPSVKENSLRRRWRHIAIWTALVGVSIGGYTGVYLWSFKPGIQRSTGENFESDLACYFFAPAVWAEYWLAEARTERYMFGLWRLKLPENPPQGIDSVPFPPMEEAGESWLSIEPTDEFDENGGRICRVVVRLPGEEPFAVRHSLHVPGRLPFSFKIVCQEAQTLELRGLSPKAHGYFRNARSIPTENYRSRAMLSEFQIKEEWFLYVWPDGKESPDGRFTSQGYENISIQPQMAILLGYEINSKHGPAMKECFPHSLGRLTWFTGAHGPFGFSQEAYWPLVWTRVPENDPDRARILEAVKKASEKPAEPDPPRDGREGAGKAEAAPRGTLSV